MLSLLLKMLHDFAIYVWTNISGVIMCKSIKIKNTMAILVESNWFNTTWSSNWLTIVLSLSYSILLALIIAFF